MKKYHIFLALSFLVYDTEQLLGGGPSGPRVGIVRASEIVEVTVGASWVLGPECFWRWGVNETQTFHRLSETEGTKKRNIGSKVRCRKKIVQRDKICLKNWIRCFLEYGCINTKRMAANIKL